jgi:hypothetical protein
MRCPVCNCGKYRMYKEEDRIIGRCPRCNYIYKSKTFGARPVIVDLPQNKLKGGLK